MKRTILFLGVVGMFAFATTATGALINGSMETFTGTYPNEVATGWTGYKSGPNMNNYSVNFSNQGNVPDRIHDGVNGQKVQFTAIRNDRGAAVYQNFSTSVGDAVSFSAWVWCNKASGTNTGKVLCSIKADLDGGTDVNAVDVTKIAGQSSKVIKGFGPSGTGGQATGTSVTVFLHAIGGGGNDTSTTYVTWDDVTLYHARVSALDSVSGATASSLDIDVDPGLNEATVDYAIKISGGSLTGDNYVQTDGSISGSKAWQSDALWGTQTVSGLEASTEYSFEVISRHSLSVNYESALGTVMSGITTPEPTLLALMGLGLPLFMRRRRRSSN